MLKLCLEHLIFIRLNSGLFFFYIHWLFISRNQLVQRENNNKVINLLWTTLWTACSQYLLTAAAASEHLLTSVGWKNSLQSDLLFQCRWNSKFIKLGAYHHYKILMLIFFHLILHVLWLSYSEIERSVGWINSQALKWNYRLF